MSGSTPKPPSMRAPADMTSEVWSNPRLVASYEMDAPFVPGPHNRHAFHAAGLAPTARILEVAAGTGPLAFIAQQFVAYTTAIDLADGMVDAMADKARRLGLPDSRLTIKRGDYNDLSEYADGQFDAVFIVFGVVGPIERKHHELVAGFSRVLKPGGKLVIVTWADFNRSNYQKVLMSAIREYVRAGAAAAGVTSTPMQPPPAAAGPPAAAPPNFSLERDVRALMSEHFSSATSEAVTLPVGRSYYGGRDFWLSNKGALPMIVPSTDEAVERQADEGAITWLDGVIGVNGQGLFTSTSILIIAVK